jgi:hypothetical protein
VRVIKLSEDEYGILKNLLTKSPITVGDVPAVIQIINKIGAAEVIEDGKQICELSRNE